MRQEPRRERGILESGEDIQALLLGLQSSSPELRDLARQIEIYISKTSGELRVWIADTARLATYTWIVFFLDRIYGKASRVNLKLLVTHSRESVLKALSNPVFEKEQLSLFPKPFHDLYWSVSSQSAPSKAKFIPTDSFRLAFLDWKVQPLPFTHQFDIVFLPTGWEESGVKLEQCLKTNGLLVSRQTATSAKYAQSLQPQAAYCCIYRGKDVELPVGRLPGPNLWNLTS